MAQRAAQAASSTEINTHQVHIDMGNTGGVGYEVVDIAGVVRP